MRALLIFLATSLLAADLGPALLTAARKGQTDEVGRLLQKGAGIESKDRDGRTALMLAARRGHVETVRALLAKGAKPDARDHDGWTAYALALEAGQDSVLPLLPQPARFTVYLDLAASPENVYSSCFLTPAQLVQQIAGLQLETVQGVAVREYAEKSGKGRAEISATEPADAILHLKVRPGVSCLPQRTVDQINFEIDVRLERTRDHAILLEKTFGGGFKGLHGRSVSSPAQYSSYFADWAHSHAGDIYWAAVEAWLRSP